MLRVIVTLIIVALCAAEAPCPVSTDIAPCVCSVEADGLQLDCSDVQSDDDLARVFQQEFLVKEFWRFYIYNNDKIEYLTDILNGVTFRDITLDYVPNLTFVSDAMLAENKFVLEKIHINNSKLNKETFSIPILEILRKLQYLYIGMSAFTNFPEMLVSESINSFHFTTGSLSHLSPDTFVNARNISYWDFKGQDLLLLRANTFYLQEGNNTIKVNYNKLHTIETGTFVMPATTANLAIELHLENNELIVLDEEVYGEIFPYVETLLIYNNPLECGCDLAWIVAKPLYLSKLDGSETCTDGTLLTDLDPAFYAQQCPTRDTLSIHNE